MESAEEPFEIEGWPMHVDQPHLCSACISEGVRLAGGNSHRLTGRQLSPLRADANVERARHHLITLLSVRVNVQRRSCKARGKHVDGLEQLASRIGSGPGNLPPHADGCEVQDVALFSGCHVAGLTPEIAGARVNPRSVHRIYA